MHSQGISTADFQCSGSCPVFHVMLLLINLYRSCFWYQDWWPFVWRFCQYVALWVVWVFSVVSSVQSLSVHLCSVIAGWSRCSLCLSCRFIRRIPASILGLRCSVLIHIKSFFTVLIASYLSSRGKHHVCNVKVQLIKKMVVFHQSTEAL